MPCAPKQLIKPSGASSHLLQGPGYSRVPFILPSLQHSNRGIWSSIRAMTTRKCLMSLLPPAPSISVFYCNSCFCCKCQRDSAKKAKNSTTTFHCVCRPTRYYIRHCSSRTPTLVLRLLFVGRARRTCVVTYPVTWTVEQMHWRSLSLQNCWTLCDLERGVDDGSVKVCL